MSATDRDVNRGRVAVITGGASGIGLGVATHLADAGHPVVLLDRQGDLAVKEAQTLADGGANALGIETDVTDRRSIDAALARVRAELGPVAIAVTSAAGWGRIVTISSSSAQSGAPDRAHYVASKGGIIALTKALSYELAPLGITVNTIPPSIIDTPMAQGGVAAGHVPDLDVLATMTPVRRTGTPDDVAAACAFLCSDAASFITGQIIGVNGGWYM